MTCVSCDGPFFARNLELTSGGFEPYFLDWWCEFFFIELEVCFFLPLQCTGIFTSAKKLESESNFNVRSCDR